MKDESWKQLIKDIEQESMSESSLLELTEDPVASVRRGAYLLMLDLGLASRQDVAEAVFESLMRGLADSDDTVLAAAGEVLASSGSRYAAAIVTRLTAHQHLARLSAARALVYADITAVSVGSVIEELIRRIADTSESHDVREASAHALANLAAVSGVSQQVVKEVHYLARSASPEIRRLVEELLPRIRTVDCIRSSRIVEMTYLQDMTVAEAAHLNDCPHCAAAKSICDREALIAHATADELSAEVLTQAARLHLEFTRCKRCIQLRAMYRGAFKSRKAIVHWLAEKAGSFRDYTATLQQLQTVWSSLASYDAFTMGEGEDIQISLEVDQQQAVLRISTSKKDLADTLYRFDILKDSEPIRSGFIVFYRWNDVLYRGEHRLSSFAETASSAGERLGIRLMQCTVPEITTNDKELLIASINASGHSLDGAEAWVAILKSLAAINRSLSNESWFRAVQDHAIERSMRLKV